MFLDAFFLQIFEHFSSTPIRPSSPGQYGWGLGVGGEGVYLDSFWNS